MGILIIIFLAAMWLWSEYESWKYFRELNKSLKNGRSNIKIQTTDAGSGKN